MSKPKLLLIALTGSSILSLSAPAQETNIYVAAPPPTILENLEAAPDQLLLKASEPVGLVALVQATVSVEYKEDTIVTANRKEYGIALDVTVGGAPVDRVIIDYDELAPLLASMDYLANLNNSVTSLSGFSAAFITKGGLRLSAFRSRRTAQVDLVLRTNRLPNGTLLTSDQWAQFRSLIDQAKSKIDTLRKG